MFFKIKSFKKRKNFLENQNQNVCKIGEGVHTFPCLITYLRPGENIKHTFVLDNLN
jgi:hypothetical protein